MKLVLHKWYLDFQSAQSFEYRYATLLEVGPWLLAGRESHRHALDGDCSGPAQSFRHYERVAARSGHGFGGKGLSFAAHRGRFDLRLEHDGNTLLGAWHGGRAMLPRLRRPLVEGPDGTCDWKVFAARCPVELREGGSTAAPRRGEGYVDFVRFALPPWRVPFVSLCWGRLFGPNTAWVVFELVLTDGRRLAGCAHMGRWQREVSVGVRRDERGAVACFDWRIAGSSVRADVASTLHAGPILDAERLSSLIPARLRGLLASGGYEEKYWVHATVGGVRCSGPMERVCWT